MVGVRRGAFVLVLAVFAAACGGPTFTSKDAAAHRLPRVQPETRIGDALTLDRTTTTDATPATDAATTTIAHTGTNYTQRVVSGLELSMQAGGSATFPQGTPVHLMLTVVNKTGRSVGYLTNRESHFTLVSAAKKTVWTDQTCRSQDVVGTTPTGYLELKPGEHVTIDDFYPTRPGTTTDGCTAPAGDSYLTGGLTVCLNLAADDSCRGASDERIQATPLPVTVS